MKTKITSQSSLQTERLEERLASKGLLKDAGVLSWNPKDNRIYIGDGREFLEKDNWLVDVKKLDQAKILGAAGKSDEVDKMKGIYSNSYIQSFEVYKKIRAIQEKYSKPYNSIGDSIVGAAGATGTTDYEVIRRTGELIATVIGQMHTNEDYQAINIAEKVDKDAVKFEYLKRTTAKITAQSNLGDEDEATSQRHVYTSGIKEIYAYGLAFTVSMRDKIDTKTDIVADFLKQVPDAFLNAKNNDVITLLNAITGTNQGDWDAMTVAGKFDVIAASQVQTAEDAVKKYGRTLIAIIPSDSWRTYMQNLQGVYFNGVEGNVANRSVSAANMKTGKLAGNPNVTYYIDDGLTSMSYVLAAQEAYMKYFQAMVIQSSYKNPRNPGQTEQRFWYDFAGFEETETGAQYKGTSVAT